MDCSIDLFGFHFGHRTSLGGNDRQVGLGGFSGGDGSSAGDRFGFLLEGGIALLSMSSRTGSKGSKPPFLSLWSLKPCCWACLWHANMEENSRFMSAWALEVAGLTMGVVTRPHCSRVMWKLMRWTGW